MHVPDVDRVLGELLRVLEPGGYLVISEGNAASVQAVLGRMARWALRRTTGVEIKRMPAGIEGWRETPDDPIAARHAYPLAGALADGPRRNRSQSPRRPVHRGVRPLRSQLSTAYDPSLESLLVPLRAVVTAGVRQSHHRP
jgi:hypothetical protein